MLSSRSLNSTKLTLELKDEFATNVGDVLLWETLFHWKNQCRSPIRMGIWISGEGIDQLQQFHIYLKGQKK